MTRIIEIRPTKWTLMKPKWSKNRNEDGGNDEEKMNRVKHR